MPLIDFLALKLAPASRKKVRQLLDRACCHINGKVIWKASWRLQRGDVILFTAADDDAAPPPSAVLFENEHIIVIDKAAGIASEAASLGAALGRDPATLMLVHRLDKETSGLLVIAKGSHAKKTLEDAFRQRLIDKRYVAVVEGVVDRRQGIIDLPLYRAAAIPGQTLWKACRRRGELPALTHWHRLAAAAGHSLLLLLPHTGRTHQLRVHLQAMGHPIVGDVLYGAGDTPLASRRHYLHARQLTLPEGCLPGPRCFEAPLPDDFCGLCRRLALPLTTTNP